MVSVVLELSDVPEVSVLDVDDDFELSVVSDFQEVVVPEDQVVGYVSVDPVLELDE